MPTSTIEFERANSVAQLFRTRLLDDSARLGARYKKDGAWRGMTWGEMAAQGEAIGWGLLSLGATRGKMVALIGSTRIEWTLCDLGVMHTGACAVPIYHSNTAEEIRYILDNSDAELCFAENLAQLKKMQEIRARLPKLSQVILMDGAGPAGDPWVLSLEQLRAQGEAYKAANPQAMAAALQAQERGDLHTLIYTSGTTGEPKGVMITNENMIFSAESTSRSGLGNREHQHLLFLPFAHSFAQLIKAGWFSVGLVQIYAESVDKLMENAQQTSPTSLSAVPRVYEKIFSAVVGAALQKKGIGGILSRMAVAELDHAAHALAEGRPYSSFKFSLAKRLVYPKMREAVQAKFGGRLHELLSGGAPLAKKVSIFLDLLGFAILEGYGLTETIALTSVNLPAANKLGTVGRSYPNVEVKIASDGEILQRGRHIMRGYYNNPGATSEVIDSEGWFHTGDIGSIDAEGFLRITDRKKDLIKTSGGKYIAPQAIEGALKTMSELVSQVVVIGDGHKYVSVLITVVEDVARKVALGAGESAGSYAELAKSKAVIAKVKEAVDKLNSTLASFETIKRFTILERDFSMETGELTPTMKVKRKACIAKFKAPIDAMYADE